MFKTGKKSYFCQNDEKFFCSNLYRSVEITDLYGAEQLPRTVVKELFGKHDSIQNQMELNV